MSLWKKFGILPKLKVTDMYLAGEIIDFFGHLNTGIGFVINFDLA